LLDLRRRSPKAVRVSSLTRFQKAWKIFPHHRDILDQGLFDFVSLHLSGDANFTFLRRTLHYLCLVGWNRIKHGKTCQIQPGLITHDLFGQSRKK
jgi:hypothetical protein